MNNPTPTAEQPASNAHCDEPASFERRWAVSTMQGNAAFAGGKRVLAESCYLDALRLARVAIGLARHDDASQSDERVEYWLSIWVLSHLNLADFHAKAVELERAMETVFAAYEEMVCCLHDTRVTARVHRACLQYLTPLLDGLRDLMVGAAFRRTPRIACSRRRNPWRSVIGRCGPDRFPSRVGRVRFCRFSRS